MNLSLRNYYFERFTLTEIADFFFFFFFFFFFLNFVPHSYILPSSGAWYREA